MGVCHYVERKYIFALKSYSAAAKIFNCRGRKNSCTYIFNTIKMKTYSFNLRYSSDIEIICILKEKGGRFSLKRNKPKLFELVQNKSV